MAEPLDTPYSLKMPKALLDGLKKIKDQHGTEPAELLRRLASAAVEFHEENGWFSLPVRVEPEVFQHAELNDPLNPGGKLKLVQPKSKKPKSS